MEASRPTPDELLKSIKAKLPELERTLEKCSGHWGFEDHLYRFYHMSFKVFFLTQTAIREMVAALESVMPERHLNSWFLAIIKEGTGKRFAPETNANWLKETRPILEAFFHARYFLEMAVKYGRELSSAPDSMPSGWAAIEYLYIWTEPSGGYHEEEHGS